MCARIMLGLGLDSLTWSATPCANFGGYVIQASQGGGPFINIDTTNALFYINSNPNESEIIYRIGMICNGTLGNLSIAVTNSRPQTPNLRNVSIVNGSPVVEWDPSSSPEVIGYQLYKENPYGSGSFFPYPSPNFIVNGLSFIDSNSGSLLSRYAIIAVSKCNKSLLGIGSALDGTTGPHTSMIISQTLDTCLQELQITWNAYENWLNGVGSYDVFVQIDNAGYQLVASLDSTTTSYTINNVVDGQTYSIYVRAKENGVVNEAVSNVVTTVIAVNNPVSFNYINSVSVVGNDRIDIEVDWDYVSDLSNVELLRGGDTSVFSVLTTLSSPTSFIYTHNDLGVDVLNQNYYYQFRTVDKCGFETRSNRFGTILLRGSNSPLYINTLDWNVPLIEYGQVIDYWVMKDGQRIDILPKESLEYEDELDVQTAASEVCYQMRANIRIDQPDGHISFAQVASNEVCLSQRVRIQVANAFRPDGVNPSFRPLLSNPDGIQEYEFTIVNRYGAQIFSTNDVNAGWDGIATGNVAKQGVYVYLIRATGADGVEVVKKGSFLLLR